MSFDPPGRTPGRPGGRVVIATPARRRRRALLITLLILLFLIVGFTLFSGFWSDWLWFQSVNAGSVFTTQLTTRIGLFLAFGAIMAVVVGFNAWLPYRLRTESIPMNAEQASLERYRTAIDPLRRLMFISLPVLLGILAGVSASSEWQTWLLWRNATPFGTVDPQFGMDISFYAFVLPWLRFLLGFLFAAVVLSFLVALVVHYLYGGVRLQSPEGRITRAAQAHLAILIGIFMLLKAAAYILDRYDLAVSQDGLVPGLTYTDVHAVLPAKTILVFVALICALLFFAGAFRTGWRLAATSFGLLLVSSALIGTIYPAFVQAAQVKPNESTLELPYIANSIDATRAAYGVANSKVSQYAAATNTPTAVQVALSSPTILKTRLLDPTLVSPTFQAMQGNKSFYKFPSALNVDRYPINGASQGVVTGVRELNLAGVPQAQRNWANDHVVYTHGYGLVAANDNTTTVEGKPVYVESSIPTSGALGISQPRIYYGENFSTYSVVGGPAGGPQRELDYPSSSNDVAKNTYQGAGGVPVGNLFDKLVYAVKYQEPNFLLSDLVNDNSKILEVRDPSDRVQKIAPWLTIDGDPYATVVNGKVVWVVDGYTTTNEYPYAKSLSLSSATSDSVTAQGSNVVAGTTDQVNYIRNSVKATVDAYDGTVTLYEWNPSGVPSDPVLATWMKAFPGLVQPYASIPSALMAHLRYPSDLFKVQRLILAQYHVTAASDFYQGSNVWNVPDDPTTKVSGQSQPPYYMQVQVPLASGTVSQYSLTTTFAPQKTTNLAAFMAVNSDASSPNYGTINILQLPTDTLVPGPAQIQQLFDADPGVSLALQSLQKNSSVVIQKGSLLSLPSAGGILYVEPYFVEGVAQGGGYPQLSKVVVGFGSKVSIADTLPAALAELFNTPGSNITPPTKPPADQTAQQRLAVAVAAATKAYDAGVAALRAGDLAAYATAQTALGKALGDATAAAAEIAKAAAAAKPTTTASVTAASLPTG